MLYYDKLWKTGILHAPDCISETDTIRTYPDLYLYNASASRKGIRKIKVILQQFCAETELPSIIFREMIVE